MTQEPRFQSLSLRRGAPDPAAVALERFRSACPDPAAVDARFLDAEARQVLAWAGLSRARPVLGAALQDPDVAAYVRGQLGSTRDGMFLVRDGVLHLLRRECEKDVETLTVPSPLGDVLVRLLAESEHWAGEMNEDGEHSFDPRTASPGTHFRTNLLVGDRGGHPNPLLTTAKAVADGWGRGSSRSHADKQILSTRWDASPEENGHPANRQFYLVEDGRQVFYSASPPAGGRATCRHASNRTVITYETPDGLVIRRTLFVVPSGGGLPLGLEAQIVTVENRTSRRRDLELVATGMFGFPHPGALTVDVIYTCVTVEPRVLRDRNGAAPLVVAPRYSASWGVDDQPFNVTLGFGPSGEVRGPRAWCLDIQRFIGSGSLEHPAGVTVLDNAYPRKGPAFFALAVPLSVEPGTTCEVHSFNGLFSRHEGEPVTEDVLVRRLGEFVKKVADVEWGRGRLAEVVRFHDAYRSAVQAETPSPALDSLLNTHLPFQIRYQTYASRSFGLTQKGFRQIGFREIQDLFAAMPFEVAAGRKDNMRDLIGVWAGHVHRFGYANHQFYWTGVEPGRYSDDALWLFQAVGRFVDLTGDASLLRSEWPVAGEDARRSLMDTLQAILTYSGRISVGKNGLPLIDHADWNDTLNLDDEGLHGPEKEDLYRRQVAEGRIREGDPLESDLSESVMNGFLLETARAYMVRFARMTGDAQRGEEWSAFGPALAARLKRAWKNDFYARCFVNRPNDAGTTYLGAAGDGLSDDPALQGTYFLNSFSWSVLSGVATEEQIAVMLERLESILLTPVGLRLSSPTRFRLLMPRTGSGDYLYGDRENGGVFKHANMMATVALLEAARRVASFDLARRLHALAWSVLKVTAPFIALEDPYRLGGNPRFCTQYTNPATGEHVGPLLSGTAPWMWLSYLDLLGVSFREGRVVLDPVLPPEWERAHVRLSVPAGRYEIEVRKPAGFVRSRDKTPVIRVDGEAAGPELPPVEGGRTVTVDVLFRP